MLAARNRYPSRPRLRKQESSRPGPGVATSYPISERRVKPLIQAHYVLEATGTPGELRVHLDTETPGFQTFLADINGKGKSPIPPAFTWTLHEGSNRLRVLPRNKAQTDGIASRVVAANRVEDSPDEDAGEENHPGAAPPLTTFWDASIVRMQIARQPASS
jgi:hypothetical protein